MQIKTSYFYQIRNFKPWMIPISTAIGDPDWYKPPAGKEWFIDKRGVINGLKYKPLIVQYDCNMLCPICEEKDIVKGNCSTMHEYRKALDTIDKNAMHKAFEHCINYFKLPFDDNEPMIVLMVHEAPQNPCSERIALQDYFKCEELKYPIKDNY